MENCVAHHTVMITCGIYFHKAAMDDIVKIKFNPDTATAYYSTAE